MSRIIPLWAPVLICLYALPAACVFAAETTPPSAVAPAPPGPAVTPAPAPAAETPAEPVETGDEPAAPELLDPAIQLGTPAGFGAPASTTDLSLGTPRGRGVRLGTTRLHPYLGMRFESRSNVFYETRRVHADTLEALDLGVHWTSSARSIPPGSAGARLLADYNARFEVFNWFSELNYISQNALVAAELRTPDFGVDLVDRLGTAHDPDTVELATLVNREVRRFYHHLELSAFQPRGEDPTAGRFGVAATMDNARYEGPALNAAETDGYGLHFSWSQPQSLVSWASDPVIFKFSMQGFDHPQPVLNNFVMYQAVVKFSGTLGEPADVTRHGATAPEPWDFELVLGVAAIDVQTFHALSPQRRQDALVPVAAFQIDGDLNTRQYLHLRLNALHEPDVSLTSNYLRRTRIAGTLNQHLGDAYEWELSAAEEWADPSQGPTLAQFTFQGEVRWYKEFPNRYFGRHAPVFFRIASRDVDTAERNRTGVHTWNDTRLTVGWALAL
ncbi:MAG TPA: hypothetical protein VL860_15275 [Planctomycetota bacterium]|nr:hypothetical protein [Planctomycetota bacterium]